MAIFEYDEGDHGAQFIGLRVAVMIDSEPRQKYYSYVKKQGSKLCDRQLHLKNEIALLKKDAKALNERWLKEQQVKKKVRHTYGKPISGTRNNQWNTGVRGLTCRYKLNDYRVQNPTLVFAIAIFATVENGDRFQLFRNIPNEKDIEAEWRILARELAKARGLKRTPAKWLSCIPNAKERAKMKRKAKQLYLT